MIQVNEVTNIAPEVSARIETLKKYREKETEDRWRKAENIYNGKMLTRTGSGGEQKATVNINETFKSMSSYVRTVSKYILSQKEFYQISPDNIEDIDFAKVFQHYVTHKVRRIPDFKPHIERFAQLTNLYGFGAGRFFPDTFEIETVNPWNIWIDEASSFGNIETFIFRTFLTEAELKERRKKEYDYKHITAYLKKVKKQSNEQGSEEERKELQKQSLFKEYTVLEYRYKKNGFWRVKTLGCDGDKPIIEFRDIKILDWCGHGFFFGDNMLKLNTLYGWGEADILRDPQLAMTMLFNTFLDSLRFSARPIKFVDASAFPKQSELDAIQNLPEGAIVPIENSEGKPLNSIIQEFNGTPISASFISLMQLIGKEVEELSGKTGVFSHGEAPPSREPGMTTAARLDISKDAMFYKLKKLGTESLATLGKQMVMTLFENPPKEEMAEILTNEGRKKVVVKKGARAELTKRTTTTVMGKQNLIQSYTLTVPTNKKKAEEFQNIQISPSFLEERNEIKQKRLVEKGRMIVEYLRVPGLAEVIMKKIDLPNMIVEILKGDIDSERFVKPELVGE